MYIVIKQHMCERFDLPDDSEKYIREVNFVNHRRKFLVGGGVPITELLSYLAEH